MKHNRYAPNEEHLRSLLRKRRKQRGLTQAGLAKILQKPQSFVSKYESGERLLTFVETVNICKALDIAPERLLKEYLPGHDS